MIYITADTNKYISDKKPSVYLKEFIDQSGFGEFQQIWNSQALDHACLVAALADDYDEFLKARSDLLAARAHQMCGIGTEE